MGLGRAHGGCQPGWSGMRDGGTEGRSEGSRARTPGRGCPSGCCVRQGGQAGGLCSCQVRDRAADLCVNPRPLRSSRTKCFHEGNVFGREDGRQVQRAGRAGDSHARRTQREGGKAGSILEGLQPQQRQAQPSEEARVPGTSLPHEVMAGSSHGKLGFQSSTAGPQGQFPSLEPGVCILVATTSFWA